MFKQSILVKTFLFPLATFLALSSSGYAQEQTEATASDVVVQEGFNGDDKSVMLGGQIDFTNQQSTWRVYVSDDALVMENGSDPQSLHYDDINWVKYPNESTLTTTEGAMIAVTVSPMNQGKGGAGILLGSGERGLYQAFTVDQNGRYHVVSKDGRRTTLTHTGAHPGILVGQPNRLSFELKNSNVVFYVNDAEVIQIPSMMNRNSAQSIRGHSGVGLAAFGLGTYHFDDVEISHPN